MAIGWQVRCAAAEVARQVSRKLRERPRPFRDAAFYPINLPVRLTGRISPANGRRLLPEERQEVLGSRDGDRPGLEGELVLGRYGPAGGGFLVNNGNETRDSCH